MVVFLNINFNSEEKNWFHMTGCPLFCSIFSFFWVLFLPRLSFRVFSLVDFFSFFLFREFLEIILRYVSPLWWSSMEMKTRFTVENKVYDGREMDRETDLSNFMHARLDGYIKRNDNKQYFISLLNPLIWQKKNYYFVIFHKKIPRIWW